MALTQSQKTLIEKARSVGGSDFAVPLTDAACCYLVAVIASDLGLSKSFRELPKPEPFFGADRNAETPFVELDFAPLDGRRLQPLDRERLRVVSPHEVKENDDADDHRHREARLGAQRRGDAA